MGVHQLRRADFQRVVSPSPQPSPASGRGGKSRSASRPDLKPYPFSRKRERGQEPKRQSFCSKALPLLPLAGEGAEGGWGCISCDVLISNASSPPHPNPLPQAGEGAGAKAPA